MRTQRTSNFFRSLKKNIRGIGDSIVEARRMEAEYRRRHPGIFE